MPRKVTIWLDCADGMQPVSKSAPLDKDYFDRCLTLTEAENKINVGRSSSNVLTFKPESDNALFTSRVVSRSHAVLSADVTTGNVMVKDLGSVHGTWVNGRRVTPHFQQHLEAGDTLIFGQNIPHASQGYHEARTFRVSYWWGDIDTEDNKKSANNLVNETAAPTLPPRPSGTFKVPSTSSEDESEEQDYDGHSDIELLTVHKKTTKQHVPTTKKEDSGIVVLSECEAESDDEVQVVSVTPNKKIIELDMNDLHNDDDDEEHLEHTQPTFTTSTTFAQTLAAYAAPADQPYDHVEPLQRYTRSASLHADDRSRTENTGAQNSHESLLPASKLHLSVKDIEEDRGSQSGDEEAGDDTQKPSTSQSTINSSTQTSGLPSSIYPNLFTGPTYSNSSAYAVPNDFSFPPGRQSRWDVGPTLAPAVTVNNDSRRLSSLYEESDMENRAKEFQSGMHELRAIHDPASSVNGFTTFPIPWDMIGMPVEQNPSAPSAPTSAKCTLFEQSNKVAVPADKSKMSISNIIEPVSKSGSPEPEVVGTTQAGLPTDQTDAPITQTEAPATKQNAESTPSVSKKRKIDDVDNLSIEHFNQDPAYALVPSINLAVEELNAEAFQSIRRKRPSIMEATHASIKSAVRARLAEKRASRRVEIKKASKKAWMASVKPFLLGTLVGSVGVFGALLSLPGTD